MGTPVSGRNAPPRPAALGTPQGAERPCGRGGARSLSAHEGICLAHVHSIVLRVRPAPAAASPGSGWRTVSRPPCRRPRARHRPDPACGRAGYPLAQRKTGPVRSAGRPAEDGDRLGAKDLPGVQPGAGTAAQRPFGAPRRYHRPRDRGRQVFTGPLPRVVGAVPPRNSGIPGVRPAPPAGPGAPAHRSGSGELHPGHRADARAGGGSDQAPVRGPAAGGSACGARRGQQGQRLASMRPVCSTHRWTTRHGSRAITSSVCSPTAIWGTCRSSCTASLTPHGPSGHGAVLPR